MLKEIKISVTFESEDVDTSLNAMNSEIVDIRYKNSATESGDVAEFNSKKYL